MDNVHASVTNSMSGEADRANLLQKGTTLEVSYDFKVVYPHLNVMLN